MPVHVTVSTLHLKLDYLLSLNCLQVASRAAEVTTDLTVMVSEAEERFKRLLAAQASRHRALLQESEAAVLQALAGHSSQHRLELTAALEGHLAAQGQLLQVRVVISFTLQQLPVFLDIPLS